MADDAQSQVFNTEQIAEIIGVSRRKLLAFVERGYVKASLREASGHGSRRSWSFSDLIKCATITMALPTLSVNGMRNLSSTLERDENVQEDKIWFVPADGGSPVVESKKADFDLACPPSATIVIDKDTMAGPIALVIDFEKVHALIMQRINCDV